MYLPSLSLLVLLGAGAALIIEKNSKPLLAFLLGFISVATVGLSYATVTQTAIWKDSLTLWDHELALYPEAYIPLMNRGAALVKMGEYDRGMKDLDRAVQLAPVSRNARYNRALALKTMGRYREALDDLNEAIKIRPDADTYNNKGNVLKRLGDQAGAVENYRKSLELDPGNGATYFNLALALEATGNIDGAIESASRAAGLGVGQANEYLNYLNSKPGAATHIVE
jgi:tetratricopeptide (TPR) repeat protein